MSDFDRFTEWSNVKLLDCPFCGGKPEPYMDGTYARLQCRECGGQTNGFLDINRACEAWNRRS